jgi:ribosomal protein RSM22 (predicted rRNA methylase)
VQLPDPVKRMIEEHAESVGFAAVKRAAGVMSDAYRGGSAAAFSRLPAAERAAAYLVTRMPATYAAAFRTLREVKDRLGSRPVMSILDLGAGTGAASLAARHWFPEASLTLVERDAALSNAARLWLPDAIVRNEDVERAALPPHDLVLAAYSLGELKQVRARHLWNAARIALLAIEPGTTAGYTLLMRLRAELLESGAHMVAPCPAPTPCPLQPPDWCHFAARVERSSLHRRIKEAALGYEDEKFSYIALAREPVALPRTRIIRRPRHEAGLIQLVTCTAQGVEEVRASKRQREEYRAARHTEWGDPWP